MIDTQNKSSKKGSGSSGIGNSSDYTLSFEPNKSDEKEFSRENKNNSDTEPVGSTEKRRDDIFEEDTLFSVKRHTSVIGGRVKKPFMNSPNTYNTTNKLPVGKENDQSHWRGSAISISVMVSESDLEGQKQNLIKEANLSETVAESVFEVFQTMVQEEAKKQNKNWSTEVIRGVTNAMIAIAIQEEKQRSLLY
jgi:hypothetical protein